MSDTEQFVAQRMPDWLAFRRGLHRYPELGLLEYRTVSRLARQLAKLGYDLRIGQEVMRPDAGHHATNFDFAERDIGVGVRLMAGLLEKASRDGLKRRAAALQ